MVIIILQTAMLIITFISIIYSVFLFFRHLKSGKRIVLITLLIFISFDIFVDLYVELDIWPIFPQLLFTNWTIPFVYGPLIFLYFLFDFHPETKLKWFHFIYFLPFIFMSVLNVPTFIESSNEKLILYKQFKENDIPYLTNDLEWIAHSIYNTILAVLIYLVSRYNILKDKIVKKIGLLAYVIIFAMQLVYIILNFFIYFSYQQNLLCLILIWFVTFSILIFELKNS